MEDHNTDQPLSHPILIAVVCYASFVPDVEVIPNKSTRRSLLASPDVVMLNNIANCFTQVIIKTVMKNVSFYIPWQVSEKKCGKSLTFRNHSSYYASQ